MSLTFFSKSHLEKVHLAMYCVCFYTNKICVYANILKVRVNFLMNFSTKTQAQGISLNNKNTETTHIKETKTKKKKKKKKKKGKKERKQTLFTGQLF